MLDFTIFSMAAIAVFSIGAILGMMYGRLSAGAEIDSLVRRFRHNHK